MAEVPNSFDFRAARKGEPLVIGAAEKNAWNETVRQVRGLVGGGGAGQSPGGLPAGVVLIKNATAVARDRFDVLALDSSLISAPNHTEAFLRAPAFTSGTLVNDIAFAILLEPIAAGKIGRARVSGLAVARLDVGNTYHTHAHAQSADATKLKTGWEGHAEILWKESGTGTKWAIVRLGSSGPVVPFELKTAFGALCADGWQYATAYVLSDWGSDILPGTDTSATITIYWRPPPQAFGFGSDDCGAGAGTHGFARYVPHLHHWIVISLDVGLVACKVQAGHTNPWSLASVKRLANDMTTEIGSAFNVVLPIPSGQDSAVFPGDIIYARPREVTGTVAMVCVSPCAGPKFNTIQIFGGSIATIPKGWKLCDGSNGTVNLTDLFVLGAGGAQVVGASGGYAKHGPTGPNNHTAHPDPSHGVTPTTAKVTADAGGIDVLTAVSVAHSGQDWSHSDTDNRGPWWALAYMQRRE